MKARDLLDFYQVAPDEYLDVLFPPEVLILQGPNGHIKDGILVLCRESTNGKLDKINLIYVHPLHFLDGAPEIVEHEVGSPFVQDSPRFIKSAFRNELIYRSLISSV